MGLFDHPNFNSRASNVTSVEHNDLARKLSAASTVLLKNSNTGGSKAPPLPLQKQGQKIAFIGRASDNCFTHSGGSGSVEPSRVVTPMQGAMSKISGSSLTYIDGKDIAAAVALAKAADVAVVFAGTTSSEGYDRSNLNLDDNLDALISAVAAAQPNTVAVLSVPGAIVMPWSQAVASIVTNFMPGQEVGSAIADVLFGDVNPSARLPITMPNGENDQKFTPEQWPGVPPSDPHATYSEGLFVGYRWYDAHNVKPAFAFGHGLSYTTFEYSNLTFDAASLSAAFSIKNTGRVYGAEVAQLYLGFPADAGEPPKVLRGFSKVSLSSGENRIVTMSMSDKDLSIWDSSLSKWSRWHGQFTIFIGASSQDIRLTQVFSS